MQPTFEEKKVQLVYDNLAGEKIQKQAISQLTEEASHEDIVSFAKIIGGLATAEEPLNHILIVESTRHTL
ncbi:DUF1659 domain-containing protein [Vagococcus vulneris]|uniref:DUF1659 domain-containing protein n=1 Tax=Vagococcus vulneris TaxID=1977869 RepID=A0A429ZZY1_9ENTE|nr:hypothetical protein [Vagococcus vulneris]RST99579.1 hypothetical protein CBF37_04425 [Vagococcus vulneris]